MPSREKVISDNLLAYHVYRGAKITITEWPKHYAMDSNGHRMLRKEVRRIYKAIAVSYGK